jgi:hypothetical protein
MNYRRKVKNKLGNYRAFGYFIYSVRKFLGGFIMINKNRIIHVLFCVGLGFSCLHGAAGETVAQKSEKKDICCKGEKACLGLLFKKKREGVTQDDFYTSGRDEYADRSAIINFLGNGGHLTRDEYVRLCFSTGVIMEATRAERFHAAYGASLRFESLD